MKNYLTGFAVVALLVVGPVCSGFADDTPAPQTPAATQAPAAQPDAPPPSVPRPSLAPKAAEPAADAQPLPPPHRRYAYHHRRWHRHYAYWEPFGPILWPHLHHNGRIYWSRIPWFVRF